MKKIFNLIILALLLFNLGSAYAHEGETFLQAKDIIKQKISCDVLGENQLEVLGEYYMEQMHPGELHEEMDAMMGGEGSESLRQMHINMGKTFYCGEDAMMSSGGMMGMMNMMSGQSGMIGNMYYGTGITIFNIFWWIIMLLIMIALVLFIIWLIKQLQKPKLRRKN